MRDELLELKRRLLDWLDIDKFLCIWAGLMLLITLIVAVAIYYVTG